VEQGKLTADVDVDVIVIVGSWSLSVGILSSLQQRERYRFEIFRETKGFLFF
jgi:hypothetical protein